MRVFWISTERMTILVDVNEDEIVCAAPPIVRKFIGQPARNLFVWMRKQPGFQWCELME